MEVGSRRNSSGRTNIVPGIHPVWVKFLMISWTNNDDNKYILTSLSTYTSVGIDDLLDVFQLVAQVLLFSHRQAIVVEGVHTLTESTAGVVERGHASQELTAATFEGHTLAGACAAAVRRVLHGVRDLGFLSRVTEEVREEAAVARSQCSAISFCPGREWCLACSTDTSNMQQVESWELLIGLSGASPGARGIPLGVITFRIASADVLAAVTCAARVASLVGRGVDVGGAAS